LDLKKIILRKKIIRKDVMKKKANMVIADSFYMKNKIKLALSCTFPIWRCFQLKKKLTLCKKKNTRKTDFVTVTNICDTGNYALFV